tara:strand:- start:243 stop:452 length:210 start_codon:yes stop_codon:yes gene_type:complete
MSRPFITVRVNSDAGEASVNYTDKFYAESNIWRLDILKDLIHDMQKVYNDTCAETFGPDDTQEKETQQD